MRPYKGYAPIAIVMLALVVTVAVAGCANQQSTAYKWTPITSNETDPASWNEHYPRQYESFLLNDEGGQGSSKYKGSDPLDRLSEFPYQLVLFDGFAFGVEYNEPRGHTMMMKDILDIDASRRKSGGVCLSCKTTYAPALRDEMGVDYFRKPFTEVHAIIPEKDQKMGVTCVDCHDPKTIQIRPTRFAFDDSIKTMGKDPQSFTKQDERSVVCGQCHVTYVVKKNAAMESVGLFYPWGESEWGNITIEDIEKVIKSDTANLEWTSKITGIKLAHIRHPEFELFTNNSTHWKAGLSCPDCHMPYERDGSAKFSTHHVQSPLKDDMKACRQCHDQGAAWLRERVITTQDRTNNAMTRAGNAAAQAAKAIEMANYTPAADQALLTKAKDNYEKAYYRVVFIGAENSMGFHNPTEALRVAADALHYAKQSEILSREALLKAGINPPEKFDLELSKYNNRGDKGLKLIEALNKEFTYDGTK